MYNSTRKDDAIGSKSDMVALFEISALGFKSRQQNREANKYHWHQDFEWECPVLCTDVTWLMKDVQIQTERHESVFLFNPAGLFKQLDVHHI